MTRTSAIIAAMLLSPLAIALVGCGSSRTPKADQAKSAVAGGEHPDQNSGRSVEPGANDPKITAALAELSVEDRALAIAQKICPVSGELLGEMGAPVKIDVKGQPVFICCEGCKDKLLANADEYLAKIKK